jgi:hypothetical protein
MTQVEDLQAKVESLERRLRRHDDLAAIGDVLASYCRGVDRMHEPTLRAIYHEDAIEDRGSGLFIGRAHDWIPWTLSLLPVFTSTQHCIFNVLIDLQGDQAFTETYFRAYHRFGIQQRSEAEIATGQKLNEDVEWPEGDVELLLGGRYLDRLERRDGVWRFSYRKMINDWVHQRPIAESWFTDNPTAYRATRTIEDSRLGPPLHSEKRG